MNAQKKTALYVLLTAFLFGTMEVALKIAGSQFQAIQLTFLRFFIGGLLLLPFAVRDLKKRHCRLTVQDFLYLLLLGVICICISMFLFQVGVMMTNANLAAVIISINPVFTMTFAHFLANDKFTRKKAVILILSIIGLVVVADPVKLMQGNHVTGILVVLVASISFGLYTAIGKRRIAKIGGLAQNSFSFLIGSSILLIIMLSFHYPVLDGIQPGNIGLLLYLGLFVTGLGYYCYLRAIALSSPSSASIAFFIKPLIAVTLSFFILGEPVTVNIIIGVLFVLAGSALSIADEKTLRRLMGRKPAEKSTNESEEQKVGRS